MRRLRSKRGFSMLETLMAMLIMGILSLAVVSGCGVAARVRRQTTEYANAQVLSDTLAAVITDELHYARDIAEDSGGVTFTSRTGGSGVSFTVGDGEDNAGQLLLGGHAVLGAQSYPDGLYLDDFSLTYDAGSNTFALDLAIENSRGEQVCRLADPDAPLCVKPLNR